MIVIIIFNTISFVIVIIIIIRSITLSVFFNFISKSFGYLSCDVLARWDFSLDLLG